MFFVKQAPDVRDITVLIKTFQRPKTVNGAIKKIRQFYPDIRILVADDSQVPTAIADDKTEVHYLPFDTGLSKGRNHLLEQVETEFFLLMDDDHFFCRGTDLDRMRDILKNHDFDILSGLVFERSKSKRDFYRKRLIDFYLNIKLEDGTLEFCDGFHEKTDEFVTCDLVHNFFLARTESVRSIGGWDNQLKIAEHADFFIRAKVAGMKVGYTPHIRVDHVHLKEERFSANYMAFRKRMTEFRSIWIEKHGIEQVVRRDGSVMSSREFIEQKGW